MNETVISSVTNEDITEVKVGRIYPVIKRTFDSTTLHFRELTSHLAELGYTLESIDKKTFKKYVVNHKTYPLLIGVFLLSAL